MTSIPSKFIGLILAFVLCVLAPLVNVATQRDMFARRQIIADVSSFMDDVVDSRRLTYQMLNDFSAKVGSHGPSVQIEISHMIRSVDATGVAGEYDVTYVNSGIVNVTPDKPEEFDTGDRIVVRVYQIADSSLMTLVKGATNIYTGELDYTLAERIR